MNLKEELKIDRIKIVSKGGIPIHDSIEDWWINYKFISMSIYYDKENAYGYSKEPYFEIMADEDPKRFTNINYLKEYINEVCDRHDIEIIKHPEYFL